MTVFTITYNEAFMLPYFVEHYRNNFPDCEIVVYDNQSDDGTQEIAYKLGCKLVEYDTGGRLSDRKYLDIKNNKWKHRRGWVIVADCDEFCDVTSQDLEEETASVLRFEGWNMVNMCNNMNLHSIRHGLRAPSYDKMYCFNADRIEQIGYGMGCHHANPVGDVVYSRRTYRARHYKYVNPDYMVQRHKVFASRLSEENLKRGYGGHYLYDEDDIRAEFMAARIESTEIL